MPLLTFKLPNTSARDVAFSDFVRRFKTSNEKKVNLALDEIRSQWQLEFVRQQRRLSANGWPLLSVNYLTRKVREYENHTSDVHYTTTLKRSGAMLEGYIKGIAVNPATMSVTINIPSVPTFRDPLGIRAYVHQGVGGIGKPKNMPRRPFQLERFTAIGKKVMVDALKRK